jgi:adenylate kinase
MIITISGTPGTGKTYISEKIAKSTGLKYFDLNKYVRANKLYDLYNKADKTYEVDIKKLVKKLEPIVTKQSSKDKIFDKMLDTTIISEDFIKLLEKKKLKGIIIDSHMSHYIKSDYCIIVNSDITNISKRLRKRKYADKKIQDNIASEIFNICLEEAKALKRNIILVKN